MGLSPRAQGERETHPLQTMPDTQRRWANWLTEVTFRKYGARAGERGGVWNTSRPPLMTQLGRLRLMPQRVSANETHQVLGTLDPQLHDACERPKRDRLPSKCRSTTSLPTQLLQTQGARSLARAEKP